MNHTTFRAIALPALLTLAFCASPARAEGAASSAPAPKAQPAAAAARNRFDRVEQRIRKLHQELHITAAEAGPWHAFAQTIRANAERMEQAFGERARKLPTMNAEQAMQSYTGLARLHARNMDKLSDAFGKLYTVLSPAQKHQADVLFRNARPRRKR